MFTERGRARATAAFGMLRTIHYGMRVGVVQFVKGAIPCGETEVFQRFGEQLEWHRMGEGFYWITKIRSATAGHAPKTRDGACGADGHAARSRRSWRWPIW